MTCFWDGIISSLDKDDRKLLGLTERTKPAELAIKLKQLNRKTNEVYWETNLLRLNEIEENSSWLDFSKFNKSFKVFS